ncbi:hypothetical protein PC116_g9535 [Phytophthora cactorum]|uniref:Uncharacterized protein n=1 Tax=Phytophthora cactorum TaxID=29920 RepID=A0A8T1L2T3_9STRA|nr:hypothetical protein Pcac1_g2961 [Phytophthora cactorum]KAG2899785.1 hypothetical protein PC114_g13798 [Phytophthora cactorum]KAG2924934.1 hypothetical protein PC117_g15283 [Phytophthora cactorum]KAG3009217.1 hypothetical protein PC119_g13967 [Phytophthora cactorum]KAG3009593.1 hypothetical protein PC120_g15543 [Phytophthora cactorum]
MVIILLNALRSEGECTGFTALVWPPAFGDSLTVSGRTEVTRHVSGQQGKLKRTDSPRSQSGEAELTRVAAGGLVASGAKDTNRVTRFTAAFRWVSSGLGGEPCKLQPQESSSRQGRRDCLWYVRPAA